MRMPIQYVIHQNPLQLLDVNHADDKKPSKNGENNLPLKGRL